MDLDRPADDLAAKAIRPLVQWMHRVWILQKATKETEIEICVALTPSLASFPSVKLLLGLGGAFFLLLNCYRLAQIGPASRIFTEGNEENEDPFGAL